MLFKMLFILGFFSLYILANNIQYTIKLAAYKNLTALNKQISKLKPTLQENIEIKKENNTYSAFLKTPKDKAYLTQILPAYKKVFADAYISTLRTSKILSSAIGAPILGSKFYYTIKLAMYRNLSSLDNEISKLAPILQKNIIIKKENDTYKTFLQTHTDKAYLTQILPAYKKVFADAFIAKVDASKVSNYSDSFIVKTLKASSKKTPFSYSTTQNHTFYICPDENRKHTYLLKVSFKKNRVKYIPIAANSTPTIAEYNIEEQKLFMYKIGSFDHNLYHTLEKKFPQYYLVYSWIGKVKINALRYYFKLKDAEIYLKSF